MTHTHARRPATVPLTGRFRHGPPAVKADLDWLLATVRPARQVTLAEIPCEIVVTANRGTNGRELVVRCRCMAGTRDVPSANYWNYDPLGVVQGLAAARELFRAHKRNRVNSAAGTQERKKKVP